MSAGELLEKLASRVEAAMGPDRDLDAAIATTQGLRVVEEGHPLGRCCYDADHRLAVIPRYTASLDAAMALLPEGIEGLPLSFKLERFYLGNGIIKCRACVWDGLGVVSSLDTATEAATPALALTAARLRARAALAQASSDGE